MILIAAAAAGMLMRVALADSDRRPRARRPGSEPARHRADAGLEYRGHAAAGRGRVCASAGSMGRGAPLRAADRARRQQSAVSARPDALAGEYFLGAAGQSQLVLCRPRIGAGVCAAAAGAPRSDQRAIHSRLRGRGHAGRCRRDGAKTMAAMSSSSCRRTAPGPRIHSPQARDYRLAEIPRGAGGSTCSGRRKRIKSPRTN